MIRNAAPLPEETAAAFRDGWFPAGDLARKDGQGLVCIVDHKKAMILSGGLSICPRAIEEMLCAHLQAPGQVRFLAEIPRKPAGRMPKRALRDRAG